MQSTITYDKFHYCKIQFILLNRNADMIYVFRNTLAFSFHVERDMDAGICKSWLLHLPLLWSRISFITGKVWKKHQTCMAQLLPPSYPLGARYHRKHVLICAFFVRKDCGFLALSVLKQVSPSNSVVWYQKIHLNHILQTSPQKYQGRLA